MFVSAPYSPLKFTCGSLTPDVIYAITLEEGDCGR